MKSLVIYDSNFGNTQKIAETIAKEFGKEVLFIVFPTINDLRNLFRRYLAVTQTFYYENNYAEDRESKLKI